MSRQVAWQRSPSDGTSWHQDQALRSTIYILREVGPTSFLLKEDSCLKKFKVSLGDPHICSCPEFKKENNLCKHICWILLKKFKLDRQNELSYQLGLVEREINAVLQNPLKFKSATLSDSNSNSEDLRNNDKTTLIQRALTEDDVCPICQDQLLAKHQPVTYCRHGCGNSVHIKCMKVWADFQKQSTDSSMVKCPFCREDFGSQTLISQEYHNTISDKQYRRASSDGLDSHLGITCNGCRMSPIKGKCYQCTRCADFHLCNTCYHGRQHMHHPFVFRLKKSQRWRSTPSRESRDEEIMPESIAIDLQTREITANDYNLLLNLDRPSNSGEFPVDLAGLPEHIINRLPMVKIKPGGRLLAPGQQCRLCLRSYSVDQFVRRLPDCGHIFHRNCIDDWLKGDHRRCPIDHQMVLDPSTKSKIKNSTEAVHDDEANRVNTEQLVIPGIGLIHISSNSTGMKTTEATSPKEIKTRRPIRPFNILTKLSSHQHRVNTNLISEDVTINDLIVQANTILVGRAKSASVIQSRLPTGDHPVQTNPLTRSANRDKGKLTIQINGARSPQKTNTQQSNTSQLKRNRLYHPRLNEKRYQKQQTDFSTLQDKFNFSLSGTQLSHPYLLKNDSSLSDIANESTIKYSSEHMKDEALHECSQLFDNSSMERKLIKNRRFINHKPANESNITTQANNYNVMWGMDQGDNDSSDSHISEDVTIGKACKTRENRLGGIEGNIIHRTPHV